MSENWYTEDVVIVISKRFDSEGPVGWEVEVSGPEGEWMGEGTAGSFAGVWDMAWQMVTGDHGDYHDVHNEWVDFDSNGQNK